MAQTGETNVIAFPEDDLRELRMVFPDWPESRRQKFSDLMDVWCEITVARVLAERALNLVLAERGR
jgi:hypothetical protein